LSPLQPSAPIAIPTTNSSDSRDNQQQQQIEESSLGSNNFSTPEEFNNNNSFGVVNEHNRFISNVSSAKTTFPV
jgi:hypothetical protein